MVENKEKTNQGFLVYQPKAIGEYIVDFYCHKENLVLEVDGSQHFTVSGIEYDKDRDKSLKNMKLKVLRFTNLDVLENIEGVIEVIERNL